MDGEEPSAPADDDRGAGADETTTIIKRLLQRAQGMRSAGPRSERSQRVLLVVALFAFCFMGWVALRNYPDDVAQQPNWAALVLVGTIGPALTILLNAMEYRLQGRMVGLPVGAGVALQVTIVGTAANLLPLPGSMVVRTQALAGEAGYRAAIRSTTVAGAIWLFCTAGLAGIAMFFVALPLVGLLLLVFAAAGLAGSAWLIRKATDKWVRLFVDFVLVENATALVGAGRLLGILLALGLDVSVGQAAALTLSGVIAAATGLFPAGLGIREMVAAGIASAVSLPASVGFVATAADRIAGLIVLAIASLVVLVVRPRATTPDPTREHDPLNTS